MGVGCYWRFKGEKAYRYGWPTQIHDGKGLVRMGAWNGDYVWGLLLTQKILR